MFIRTGLTIDEYYNKPEGVQKFLLASITFQLEREHEEAEAIRKANKAARNNARRR